MTSDETSPTSWPQVAQKASDVRRQRILMRQDADKVYIVLMSVMERAHAQGDLDVGAAAAHAAGGAIALMQHLTDLIGTRLPHGMPGVVEQTAQMHQRRVAELFGEGGSD